MKVIHKSPSDTAKISAEEEKVLKFERVAEAQRQKQLLVAKKEEEKKAKVSLWTCLGVF